MLGLSQQSEVEEVRSSCFKIFSILAKNPSKQMVKQLYFKTDLLSVTMKQLKGEESEDVLCSILSFLINLTVSLNIKGYLTPTIE